MNSPYPNQEQELIREGKIFAILSYLSIFCIVPLVLKKDNPFVLNHGKQGLVIFVAQVAAFVVHIILGTWILRLAMFILGLVSLVGIISVLRGQYIKLPFISEIAEQISL